ncbi:uncharacterized protein LOC126841163 [Adelges cooleyi]|uniref:uncharacterized protein LOC126841163 n=1 Tax=Adelges cooleyi TaxID=133065 RepID=UPI002180054A|nr:uncharacterized protein LOC126841163 [Adelges cooleyi]
MKFLYILLSFGSLVNVLVALDEYSKQVITTTQQMSETKTTLPYLIQDFVHSGLFTIVELGLIFAVPDAEDNDVKDYIKQQDENSHIEDYVRSKKIYYQRVVQINILERTNIPAPQIDEDKFRDANLRALGDERRKITLEAIRLLILDVINGKNRNFRKFSDMCCLLGVFRSIKEPTSFIVNTKLNATGLCCLVDKNENVIKYYTVLGRIWEVTGFLNSTLLSDQIKPEAQPEVQPEIQPPTQ